MVKNRHKSIRRDNVTTYTAAFRHVIFAIHEMALRKGAGLPGYNTFHLEITNDTTESSTGDGKNGNVHERTWASQSSHPTMLGSLTYQVYIMGVKRVQLSATILEQQAPLKTQNNKHKNKTSFLSRFPLSPGSVSKKGTTATAQSMCFEGILCRQGSQEGSTTVQYITYDIDHNPFGIHQSPQAKPNARTASIDRNSLTALSPPSFRRVSRPSGAWLVGSALAASMLPSEAVAGSPCASPDDTEGIAVVTAGVA